VSDLDGQLHADNRRLIFELFLELDVDVNARNAAHRTALELFLENSSQKSGPIYQAPYLLDGMPSTDEADAQVLNMFDAAGIRWSDRDHKGRTPLHVVASVVSGQALFRASYLLDRGADATLQDDDGMTAADMAEDLGREALLQLLREAHSQG
jgi:ankyrin repeat protein